MSGRVERAQVSSRAYNDPIPSQRDRTISPLSLKTEEGRKTPEIEQNENLDKNGHDKYSHEDALKPRFLWLFHTFGI